MGGKWKRLRERVRKVRSERKWKIKVKTWMLLLILAPLLFVDATLLRLDHIRMTELRDAVLEADAAIPEEGEDSANAEEKLREALVALKEFTLTHIVVNVVEENGISKVMFGTGPFYLEHQYIRAANRALEEAEKKLTGDGNPYGNIYGEAGEICRPLAIQNGWTWDDANFINCMLGEIQKYPSANEIQDTIVAALPSTELYRKNYASPVWAPTPAGFLILVTLVIIVVIFIRILVWIVLRLALIFL